MDRIGRLVAGGALLIGAPLVLDRVIRDVSRGQRLDALTSIEGVAIGVTVVLLWLGVQTRPTAAVATVVVGLVVAAGALAPESLLGYVSRSPVAWAGLAALVLRTATGSPPGEPSHA